jgi:amino acid adenylation domain-containing protein
MKMNNGNELQPQESGRATSRVDVVDVPVHVQVEQYARRAPDADAIVFGARRLSYRELDQRANQMARRLIAEGVLPDALVGVAISRSLDLYVALLAVLKAGAGYLPLDVGQPAQRLRFMLEDSGAPIVLTTSDHAEAIGSTLAKVICVDTQRGAIATLPSEPPDIEVAEQSLAYCIYTSGTTGRPKGVVVQRDALSNLISWHGEAFEVSPRDKVLQFANVAFDAATWEIWGALCHGAALYPAPVEDQSLADLCEFLSSCGVTLGFLPTPLLELLVASGEVLPPTLRLLLTGGDRLRTAGRSAVPVVNNYGPTETCVVATSGRVHESKDGRPPSIGRAIANCGVRILTQGLLPQAVGEEGQLCIHGAGIARGYLRHPRLTAEKFVPDPFGPPGSRMYLTGDLCRQRDDGEIDYCGRMDLQVKIRGFRIELGEIEAALMACAGVSNAVVHAGEDPHGVLQLVAHVVADATAADRRVLGVMLGERLPEYMVPQRWVFLPELPLSPNGKIDRKALPAPNWALSCEDAAGTVSGAALSVTESQVVRIWLQVLGVQSIDANTGFRTLGGTSMQAMEIVARVAKEIAVGFQAPMLNGNDTVAEYARRLDDLSPTAADWPFGSDDASLVSEGCLSRAQEQVYFLEHMDGAWRAYRSHASMRLRGRLQVNQLELSIDDLLDRHDVLRSAFAVCDSRIQRRLVSLPKTRLEIVDLSLLPGDEREAALARHITKELDRPFDLANPPLIRWLLIKLGDEEHELVQSEHHDVHDGQSFRLMLRDIAAFYTARVRGEAPRLPAVEATYDRFCAEERQWTRTQGFQRQLSDWADKLHDMGGAARLFENLAAPMARCFRGRQVRRTVPAALVQRLRAASAEAGVSLFASSMAAFATLCGRVSQEKSFFIGTAVANRPSANYRSTVGMFVNAIAVRFDGVGERPFAELVGATARELDFGLARSTVPMSEIVKRMGLTKELAGEPPFNVCFSFHDSLPLRPRFEGLDVSVREGLSNGSAKFDMNVVGLVDNESTGGDVELLFEYDRDRLSEGLVEAIASSYVRVLDVLVVKALEPCDIGALLGQEGLMLSPAPARRAPEAVAPPTPATPVDTDLAQVLRLLRELMPSAELQADDDIFDQGAHSILLMEFVSRCRSQFPNPLKIRDAYKLATPRKIAAALGAAVDA